MHVSSRFPMFSSLMFFCVKVFFTDSVKNSLNSLSSLSRSVMIINNNCSPTFPGPVTESDCKKHEFFLSNHCYKVCPEYYYFPSHHTNTNQSTAGTRGYCEPCHKTCLRCFGPSENECIVCEGSFQLTKDYRCSQTFFSQHTDIAFLILILALCCVAVVLFMVIFTFLQAMEHGYCCFRNKVRNNGRTESGGNHQELVKKAVVNGRGRNEAERPDLVQQNQALLDSESEDETMCYESKRPLGTDIPWWKPFLLIEWMVLGETVSLCAVCVCNAKGMCNSATHNGTLDTKSCMLDSIGGAGTSLA